jgi:hypothetical protein
LVLSEALVDLLSWPKSYPEDYQKCF